MFRQRLLTSLVLIPLVLLAIFYAKLWFLSVIVGLLVVAGGWEWLQLIPIQSIINKIFFIMALIMLVGLCPHWFDQWLLSGLVFWGLITLAVLTFPASQTTWGNRTVVGGSGLFLLPLFASALAAIYQQAQGPPLIVYLLCLVWATDIGAYLAGKRFGRHKLIPLVSPGKTMEGASGGILLAMLVALIGYFYFKPDSPVIWYFMALVTVLISMVGDLVVSMLKRRSKIKDTGAIFPGHGGVLDRLDSLIAAAPIFYFFLSFLVIGR